jgi:hypothetical protein
MKSFTNFKVSDQRFGLGTEVRSVLEGDERELTHTTKVLTANRGV